MPATAPIITMKRKKIRVLTRGDPFPLPPMRRRLPLSSTRRPFANDILPPEDERDHLGCGNSLDCERITAGGMTTQRPRACANPPTIQPTMADERHALKSLALRNNRHLWK
ncbi:hypothetical protein [Xanthobacter sediminis]